MGLFRALGLASRKGIGVGEGELTRRKFLTIAAAAAGAVAAPISLDACSASGTVAPQLLRVGWTSEPDILNPFTFTSSASGEILALVYDNLLTYGADLKPVPGLATSWSNSTDGKSITYKLRSGVTWHDGSPFTAEDVKFTWDVISSDNLGQAAQYLTDLTSVEISDTHTVVAHFKRPQAFNPALIIPIVPKHLWGSMSGSAIQKFPNPNPVGTGPYRFTKWAHGQYVQVNRNDKWWGPAPSAGTVTWVHFDSPDVMTQNLITGQVDVLTEVPPLLWQGLQSKSKVKAVEMPSYSFHHIGINVSASPKSGGNPLLLDKTVRQALSCALDRNQLVELALSGKGIPGSVLLPHAFGTWQEQIPASEQLNANPTKAAALLDAAGYTMGAGGVRVSPGGKQLSFRLIAIQATDVDVRAAQLFVAAAAKVGIKLTLQTLDETTLGNIVYNSSPNWDLFVWGWDSGTPDPDYLLGVPLTSQIGNNNDVFYSNPSYDALYNKQATTLNEPARIATVHQMQRMYYDDAAYLVMWYQSKLQAYRTDTWQGWVQIPGGMVFNFTRSNYLAVTPVA
ncbi:MAG: ABC transporter substrate-binding protein [Nocardioidaceae bacterium]